MKRLLSRTFGLLILLSLAGCHEAATGVLNPEGIVTYAERHLFFNALALMLIVVIPVIIMSFAFIIRYRASHKTAEYKPNWAHNVFFEIIWWGVPCAIIIVLAIITSIMTHKLDPYRKINVPGTIMPVEAVALPWKWLFIYPTQNIATVNRLEIPKGQQVEFFLTSDNVPMSAFFIPQLSSQIYTMAGMRTRLHLVASRDGIFEGLNAQYNGDGFSDMHFEVHVVAPAEMQRWVKQVKQSSNPLTLSAYQKLLQPVSNAPVQYYSSAVPGLFEHIVQKYKQTKPPSPGPWNKSKQ